MKTKNASIIFLMLICINLPAQNMLPCQSDQIMLSKDARLVEQIENARDQCLFRANNPVEMRKQHCNMGTWKIPVVFHVIHKGGDDSIPMSQIQSQMLVLNNDYRKVFGTPGYGNGADALIEFHLAQRTPTGGFTSGVEWIRDTTLANYTFNGANDSLLKATYTWPSTMYLNVFIVDTINYANFYLLGYSTFPSNGHDITDGIVLADDFVGDSIGTSAKLSSQPYHKGTTLVHEVGHWLGLFHTFQTWITYPNCEGNTAGNCASSGDFICDTPPQYGAQFGTPAVNTNSCAETPVDNNDPVHNYMNYVDDVWMTEFTAGQAVVMQTVLDYDTGRLNLSSTENLARTGVNYIGMPDPYFTATNPPLFLANPNMLAGLVGIPGCVGDSIKFFDLTLGIGSPPLPITIYEWKFWGATPDTSNLQNPVVMYNDTGTFFVQLKVTTPFGQCVYARPFVIIGGASGTVSANTVSLGNPTTFNHTFTDAGTYHWDFGDPASPMDSSNLVIPTWTYMLPGIYNFKLTFTPSDSNLCVSKYFGTAEVSAFLPVEIISLSAFTNPNSTITISWTTLSEINSDYFIIERSDDGIFFDAIGKINGAGNSAEELNYQFIDAYPSGGNNYYRIRTVDFNGDVKLTSIVNASIETDLLQFELSPNIVTDQLNLVFSKPIDEDLTAEVFDLTGRLIISDKIFSKADHSMIQISKLQSGEYFIRLSSGAEMLPTSKRFFKL